MHHPSAKVHIPPPKLNRGSGDEGLVPITDLEPWAQLAFKGTKRLNPMQSKVRRGVGGQPASQALIMCVSSSSFVVVLLLYVSFF